MRTLTPTVAIALVIAALAHPALAGVPFTLDFEGLGDNDPILEFYNGGTSGQGFSGVDYGVSFSGEGLGLIDADAGGFGNFENNPSGITVAYFPDGPGFTMNIATGFDVAFSLWYVNDMTGDPDSIVQVFDGLDGTGNLLAELALPINDFDGGYDDWDLVGVAFNGVARSVRVDGHENKIAFDDMTFGEIPAPGIPATAAVLAILTPLTTGRRRRG